MESSAAVLEVGLVLLAATGVISTELYLALVAAVAISIAVSTVLVRPLWQRPIPA